MYTNNKNYCWVIRFSTTLVKGHIVYLNNFYNSYELQLELYSRDAYTVGILQKNCKGNSKAIVNVNLKKGEAVYRRNGVPEM